ncbi:hypothetical protein CLOM_g19925 [Closterium sp. NIES-68]|nr:hypothetical protein CLOM_g19925 [Closterium sp. NIES-68]
MPVTREACRSPASVVAFFSNADIYHRSPGHRAPDDIWHQRTKLKSFQSDGALEYQSQRFRTYLAERGIRRLVSLPYAHQQQGVAERMNRTLQTTMRKLLLGMRLPNALWPDAMTHAVHLHNLLSSSSLPNNASPHLLTQQKKTYLEPRKLPDHSHSVPYLFHSMKIIPSIATTSTPFTTSPTKVTLHLTPSTRIFRNASAPISYLTLKTVTKQLIPGMKIPLDTRPRDSRF